MTEAEQNQSGQEKPGEPRGPKHQKDTVISQWGKAGSALGDFAGSVTRQVRDDLGEDGGAGLRKLRAEATGAVDSVRSAESRDDYLEAGRDLAKDTGEFLRGLAGSVREAVSGARSSEEGEQVKSAFAGAVESSRDRIDDATDAMRARRRQREERAAETSDGSAAPEPDIIDGEVISDEGGTPQP